MHSDMVLPMTLVIACATILTRSSPFLLPRAALDKFQKFSAETFILPIILGVLVAYSLIGTGVENGRAVAWFIASAIVTSSFLWKRNVLISIALGTAFYMIMVQKIITQ